MLKTISETWKKHFVKADSKCRINSVIYFRLKDSSYIIFYQLEHFWNEAFSASEYSENLRYFQLYQVVYIENDSIEFILKGRRVQNTRNCDINTVGNFINRSSDSLSFLRTN